MVVHLCEFSYENMSVCEKERDRDRNSLPNRSASNSLESLSTCICGRVSDKCLFASKNSSINFLSSSVYCILS